MDPAENMEVRAPGGALDGAGKPGQRRKKKLARKTLCEPNHCERARKSDPVTKKTKIQGEPSMHLMRKTNPEASTLDRAK
jgi:hypothetical protein